MARKRTKYDDKLKASILDRLARGQSTVADEAKKHKINQFIIYGWRRSAAKAATKLTPPEHEAKYGLNRTPKLGLGLPKRDKGLSTDLGFAEGVSLGLALHKLDGGLKEILSTPALNKTQLKEFGDTLRVALRAIDGA